MASNLDSVESRSLDNSFNSSFHMDEGFEFMDGNRIPDLPTIPSSTAKPKSVAANINKTVAIPMVLYTDAFTAEQTIMLLGMIRYCMDKSAEGKSGDNREFTINLKIRNRSNSDFMIEFGDDSIGPIPNENEAYIGH